MTTITRERLLKIQHWRETYGADSNVMLPAEEAEELARIALASLNATPIYQVQYGQQWRDVSKEVYGDHRDHGSSTRIVYAEPVSQPYKLPEEKGASLQLRNLIRKRHAEWSDSTFGNVGPVGPLKHLSKEALEAAAEPGDLSEWADMQFLLWDAQRRAGISDGEITAAMEEKLKVNMARQWPEPKDGEPRLHIKEQPVPVAPEECPAELPYAQVKAAADLYALCRQSGEVVTYTPDPEKATIWLNNYSGTCVQEYVKLERLQEALAGNASIIPDGYALVPVEPTDEMIEAAMNCEDVLFNSDESFCVQFGNIYEAMLAAAPKPEVK
ncbi:DUF550 domain-containing protein [Salmonella enterica]|uniref:DUF550 domain-containing protein n=1 Tax=Salmonella enterica TaxID=28901 RepID=UPI0020CA2B85|nr:DUF550 domain-containing protein [Salmonella enterica]